MHRETSCCLLCTMQLLSGRKQTHISRTRIVTKCMFSLKQIETEFLNAMTIVEMTIENSKTVIRKCINLPGICIIHSCVFSWQLKYPFPSLVQVHTKLPTSKIYNMLVYKPEDAFKMNLIIFKFFGLWPSVVKNRTLRFKNSLLKILNIIENFFSDFFSSFIKL